MALAVALAALLGACGGPGAMLGAATDLAGDGLAASRAGQVAEARRLHESALEVVARVLSEFPDSEEAAALTAGRTELAGAAVRLYRAEVVPDAVLRHEGTGRPGQAAVYQASRLPEPRRARILAAVARRLGEGRDASLPAEAARRLGHSRAAVEAWLGVAAAHRNAADLDAAAEAIDQALATARALRRPGVRAEVIPEVVTAFIELGRFDKGVDVARAIPEPAIRAALLTRLGHDLAASDRGPEATIVLEEALAAAKLATDPGVQATLFLDLAEVYAKGGAIDGARILLERSQGLAESLPITPQELALLRAVGLYARLGEADRAVEAARAIPSEDVRAQAFVALAEGLDTPESTASLAAAMRAAALEMQDDTERGRALGALATALWRHGADAEAMQAAASITVPDVRARALADLARSRCPAELIGQASSAVEAMFRDAPRAGAWAYLAGRLVHCDAQTAQAMLERAWTTAGEAQAPATRTARTLAIAEAAIDAEQPSIAVDAIQRGVHAAAGVADALTQASELSRAARLAARIAANEPRLVPILEQALVAAVRATARLEFEGSRATMLYGLARLLEDADAPAALPGLREVAEGLTDPQRQTGILHLLALEYAAHGQVDEALTLARRAGSAAEVERTLADLAGRLAGRGEVVAAIRIALDQTAPGARALALASVAAHHPGPAPAPTQAGLAAMMVEAGP